MGNLSYDRIGITGATGFIGSNLAKHFKKRGIKYYAFKGNLLNKKDVEEYFRKYKINQVVHLVGGFKGTFAELITINLLTTQNLLEVGVRLGLKKIIYSSSGAVYGEPLHKTGSKESDPLRPNTLYGVIKMLSEQCIEYYQREYGIISVILRLPNVYGPGQKRGVIADFLREVKESGKLTIDGDGRQTRNFLHVDDLCKALEKSLSYNRSIVLNITSPKKKSIREIAMIIIKKTNCKMKYKKAENNLQNLLLDPGLAKKKINFSAKKTFSII